MWRDWFILALGFVVAGTGFRRCRREPDGLHGPSPEQPLSTAGDDLRERFLSTISHELRTPLNAILGWAQMLKTGRLNTAEAAHAVDAIDRNAHLEVRLIEDLLDVSRMRQGQLQIRRVPVDFGAVVHRVIEAMRPVAQSKRIELCDRHAHDDVWVLGDRGRLEQMVRHVIANAVKFTTRGRIDVDLATDGAFAELRVIDNGVGIAAEHLERVVEPFYQAPSAVLRSGLGVGLTIARELVVLHHGELEIDSRGANRGTQVAIRLPLTRARQRAEDGAARVAAWSPDNGRFR